MFKDHLLGTSVLDDFDFYENKEKPSHNTKSNQQAPDPSEVDFDAYISVVNFISSYKYQHLLFMEEFSRRTL